MEILNHFTSNIGNSAYFNILSTYWDASNIRPSSVHHNGTFFIHPIHYSKTISQDQLGSILQNAIVKGDIYANPGYENNYYNIFPSDDIVSIGLADCKQSCGYHYFTTFDYNNIQTNIKYGVVSNPASVKGCDWSCSEYWLKTPHKQQLGAYGSPNGNWVADTMVSLVAHELGHAIVDPYLSNWYTDSGEENSDLCSFEYGDRYTVPSISGLVNNANMKIGGRDYLVQAQWANVGYGCCALEYPFASGSTPVECQV